MLNILSVSCCVMLWIFVFILGSDCYDLFKTMQTCMQKYPTLYNKDLGDDEDLNSMDKMDLPSEVKNESVLQDGKAPQ